ncbi:MAG: nucleotide-binding universal stress UspA family protein [Paracoccaceae bacterium]|jgi:nucleotide-binding universal stress UspA family protein
MDTHIIGVDLTAHGDDALARGLEIAERLGARVIAVRCDPAMTRAGALRARDRLARRLRGDPRAACVPWRALALAQTAGAAIPALARATGATLITIGGHRPRPLRDLALAGTGETILHAAPCPLVAATPGARRGWRAALAAVDFSAPCAEAMRAAARLAPGMPIDAVHAVHVPSAAWDPATAAAALDDAWREMERFRIVNPLPEFRHARVVAGGVRPAIAAAMTPETDLLILGADGHGRVRDYLLGSVAFDLLRDPPCDLLLARGLVAR